MSRSVYEIYISKIFEMAKTIVVKHEETALAMNSYSQNVLGYNVNPNDRWSWRYYKNMAGEYHEQDHAELAALNGQNGSRYMTIRIAGDDGPVEVNFTKDLLHGDQADSGLVNEFTYNSRSYKDLLERYPDYESLILGILNPVDIDTAILAPNHSVLYCGDYFAEPYNGDYNQLIYVIPEERKVREGYYIETQETNLIAVIQDYFRNVIFRWNVSEYQLSDNLYWATVISNTYAFLPMVIINARVDNCLTPRAHTYHITEYLESNGQLGRHVPNLPIEQAMYLYRNVKYLTKNYGKQSTFDELVANMLTPNRVPIANYRAVHNTVEMPETIYPIPQMLRTPINLETVGTGIERRPVRYVMEKEIPLAKDNGMYLDERLESTEFKIKAGGYDDLKSKVLESSMIDYSDTERFKLVDVLVNMWIWSACRGFYTGSINVTHPYTGERIQLNPLNSLLLFYYLVNVSPDGKKITEIPKLYPRWIPIFSDLEAEQAAHGQYPTRSDVNKLVNFQYVKPTELDTFFKGPLHQYRYTSTKSFYTEGVKIHKELLRKQRELYGTEDVHGRWQLEHVMRRFYWMDVESDPNMRGETYDTWLLRQGINFEGMEYLDFINLALELVTKATGMDTVQRRSMADMQQSLLDIMQHFSSYTVQYLKGITFGSPVNTDGKLIRLSDSGPDRGIEAILGGYIPMSHLNGVIRLEYQMGGLIWLNDHSVINPMEIDGGFDEIVGASMIGDGLDIMDGGTELTLGTWLPMSGITSTTVTFKYDD